MLLFALAFCWGPSFLFIKLSIEEFSPLSLVFFRITLASVILIIICSLQRKNLFHYRRYAKHFFVTGLSSAAIPFFLISFGEKYIPSSLAAVINGSVPIFVLLLGFLTRMEQITSRKLSGVLLGVIGLIIIFLPSLINNTEISLFGSALVCIASIFYAIGMLYSRRFLMGLPFLVAPTMQIIFSTLCLLPFFLFLELPHISTIPTITSIIGIIGLSFFGTIMAFILYYKILELADASFLSLSTMLFPLIGLILGIIFLKEAITWSMLIGAAFIFMALIFTNPYIRKKISTE